MIHCYIIQLAIDSETSFEYVIFFSIGNLKANPRTDGSTGQNYYS